MNFIMSFLYNITRVRVYACTVSGMSLWFFDSTISSVLASPV